MAKSKAMKRLEAAQKLARETNQPMPIIPQVEEVEEIPNVEEQLEQVEVRLQNQINSIQLTNISKQEVDEPQMEAVIAMIPKRKRLTDAQKACKGAKPGRSQSLSPDRKRRGDVHKSDPPTAISEEDHARNQAEARKFAKANPPDGESDREDGETMSEARARYELFIQILYDNQTPQQLSNLEANRTGYQMDKLLTFIHTNSAVVSLILIGITKIF